MNVLILAAGLPASATPGTSGADYPVWLSEAEHTTFLERKVGQLGALRPHLFVYALRREDIRDLHIDDVARLLTPGSRIVEIARPTGGAACTAMLCIGAVPPDAELIVTSVTDHLDADLERVVADFRFRGADAGVVTFPSIHPRYSFVRVDDDGWVVEAAEKHPISRDANAGFYWFRRASDFFRALQKMIIKDANVNGAFYICPALNELVLEQAKIAAFHVPADRYRPLKAARQADAFAAAIEGAAS